eukprot:637336-Pelagomonas_calceolata.AAC.2
MLWSDGGCDCDGWFLMHDDRYGQGACKELLCSPQTALHSRSLDGKQRGKGSEALHWEAQRSKHKLCCTAGFCKLHSSSMQPSCVPCRLTSRDVLKSGPCTGFPTPAGALATRQGRQTLCSRMPKSVAAVFANFVGFITADGSQAALWLAEDSSCCHYLDKAKNCASPGILSFTAILASFQVCTPAS